MKSAANTGLGLHAHSCSVLKPSLATGSICRSKNIQEANGKDSKELLENAVNSPAKWSIPVFLKLFYINFGKVTNQICLMFKTCIKL